MAEFMFLGLRMTRGIAKAEFERQFGSEIDAIYRDVLRKYKSMGLLLEENGRNFSEQRRNPCKQFRYGGFFAVNALTNKCSCIILMP